MDAGTRSHQYGDGSLTITKSSRRVTVHTLYFTVRRSGQYALCSADFAHVLPPFFFVTRGNSEYTVLLFVLGKVEIFDSTELINVHTSIKSHSTFFLHSHPL